MLVTVVGLAVEVALAGCYLYAAARAGRRHRPWPRATTVALLAGLGLLVVVLQSPLASYAETVVWVHDLQHAVLMSVAPVLLALGAPVTLSLQVLPTRTARRL